MRQLQSLSAQQFSTYRFNLSKPTMPSDDELKTMAYDPAHSHWFRNALLAALIRDPVDAANDAGLLAIVLDKRATELGSAAIAQAAIEQAAKR